MARDEWQEIYERTFARLYRALIVIGARPDEAEDALHEAFIKGMDARVRIDRPDAWLFVVASRAWRRRRIRERMLRPLLAVRATSDPPNPDSTGILNEIARLPLRQRQVFVARYVLGLSQEETAQALGLARGTVSSTTSQATAALRARLRWMQ